MAKKKEQEKKIQVTLKRSLIGQLPAHRKTVQALGLRKIGHTRQFTATRQILGMINKVQHMVTWKEI